MKHNWFDWLINVNVSGLSGFQEASEAYWYRKDWKMGSVDFVYKTRAVLIAAGMEIF